MIWEAGAEGLKQVQGYLGSIVGVSSCWTTWDPALASLPLKEEGEGGAEKKKGKRGGRGSHWVTLCLLPIFLSHWFRFVLNLLRSGSSPSSAGFYWVLSCDKRWYSPPHRNWVTTTVPWWPPPLLMLLNMSHMLPSMLPPLLSPLSLSLCPTPWASVPGCSPAVNSSPQPQPSLVHWVITVTSYWGTHH